MDTGATSYKSDSECNRLAQTRTGSIFAALNQFNLVAVRVGDKSDDGRAAFYRPRFSRHVAASRFNFVDRCMSVRHA